MDVNYDTNKYDNKKYNYKGFVILPKRLHI